MASLKDYKPHKAPKNLSTPTPEYPFLIKAFSLLNSEEEIDLLFRTLCVDQEYVNLNLRLKIVYYLKLGYTYEKIRDTLHCATHTISYISRRMKTDTVGFDNLFEILKREKLFPDNLSDLDSDSNSNSNFDSDSDPNSTSTQLPIERFPTPSKLPSFTDIPKGVGAKLPSDKERAKSSSKNST